MSDKLGSRFGRRLLHAADQVFLALVDRMSLSTGQLCLAYGGTMPVGRVRVCEKKRWHIDSHRYEWLDFLEGELGARGGNNLDPQTIAKLFAADNDRPGHMERSWAP